MTPDDARRLLDLTVEYQASVEARASVYAGYGGTPAGREPEQIAADYARVANEDDAGA